MSQVVGLGAYLARRAAIITTRARARSTLSDGWIRPSSKVDRRSAGQTAHSGLTYDLALHEARGGGARCATPA